VRDVDALAGAIRDLAHDAGRRADMGVAARARAERDHDERVVISRQIEAYERLL
jgi:glycosyltransferase involved in cell wall biosynthesis